MFDTPSVDEPPPREAVVDGAALDDAGVPVGEEWDVWIEQVCNGRVPDPEEVGQVPASQRVPSGWSALELDQSTADPAGLSDADLIEGIVGFDRMSSWAAARQSRLLAEFARRRPAIDTASGPRRSDVCSGYSEFAADEVGLALRLSRTIAADRLYTAELLSAELPATLAAWQQGSIDAWKVRAIVEAVRLLPGEQRGALEARVLGRAPEQTLGQLRACLRRGVLALDPHGAEARHREARKDRRVALGDDTEGMATLWALLSAPDATAAYQRLCQLARALGAADPRGMDARRADLLVDLLTGRRCAATGTPEDEAPEDCAGCPGGDCETAPTGDDSDLADDDGNPAGGDNRGSGGHRCGAGPGAGKPLVHVIVPITMLMGLDETPGELVGHGPIPAALAREIAAGGTWRRLLTDPKSGTLLDYGRTTYTPPAGLADHVRARDLYCRSPICRQRAATADLDHTIPYPDGPTSEFNLYAGCRHDHLAKTHAPGWHVEQHPDATITWTTPTGHTYTSRPHDYRPEPGPDPPHQPQDTDPPPPF
ncbi:MAG: DUF222 domain-containing protein [Pseudonocardiaceae bacterium]|nr:DUF222 domain-containing protein [Pseudonocardiaceae bacterium]